MMLLFIVILAICLRFNNLNWDENFHLHPDERFLTMIGNATKIPRNAGNYFNPQNSTLNPTNVGFPFYVYGTFPVTLNKLVAVVFGNDDYNNFTLQGRLLSGLSDLLIVLVVYKTVELLVSIAGSKHTYSLRNTKYWAAFFYAIAVLPIQLSHFFTVDTFLNFFSFASFYFILRFYIDNKKYLYIFLSAALFGLALSCKITTLFILPLDLAILGLAVFNTHNIKRSVIIFILYFIVGYFTVRLCDPYIFQSANFFDPTPNSIFLTSIKTLESFNNANIWYPPGVQWASKPAITFALVNLAVFGVGIPYFLMMIIGIVVNIKDQISLLRQGFEGQAKVKMTKQIPVICLLILWILSFFIYQSTQFAKSMRYFILLYPFLAIFAAFGMDYCFIILKKLIKSKTPPTTIYLTLTTIVLIWPLMFSSIYINKNSRVAASVWIWDSLPNNSLILSEYWDDALPLPTVNSMGRQFRNEALPIFDPDTPEKWQKIDDQLRRADYYILSSNRAWGSIPTVPSKYPRSTKFYESLFGEKLGYKRIKEFTSYPSLRWLGIPLDFPDQWSEEAFTVYDHPQVFIYKNVKKF